MTRPRKATVDYFPHACNHGKTMFIIEESYGNDGYAFWFKLLELLGKSEGHVYDAGNPAAWRFLVAKTRVNEQTAADILNTLSELEAIDPDLWKEKIIWSQNFVDGIKDAYKKRVEDIPIRPDFRGRKPPSEGISSCSYPQSKVKESKEKESKEKKPPKIPFSIPNDFSISEDIRAWAKKEGFEPWLEEHLAWFIDYAKAGNIKQVDWDAKFRNAIRGDWGKIRANKNGFVNQQDDWERTKEQFLKGKVNGTTHLS